MRYTRQYNTQGPRFSWHYLEAVREAAIGGLEASADIAQALRRKDHRITTEHVTYWRRQYPEFDRECKDALEAANTAVANVVYEAALGGDLAAAKYWLDRRSAAFMPKQKNVHEVGEQLDDILRRRAKTPEELKDMGVLIDQEPAPLEDGDGYD